MLSVESVFGRVKHTVDLSMGTLKVIEDFIVRLSNRIIVRTDSTAHTDGIYCFI